MNASHATGAALGAILGAILVASLKRYGVTSLSLADASLVGSGMIAAGTGVAHAAWNIGLSPIFSRLIHGPGENTGPPPADDPAPPTVVITPPIQPQAPSA